MDINLRIKKEFYKSKLDNTFKNFCIYLTNDIIKHHRKDLIFIKKLKKHNNSGYLNEIIEKRFLYFIGPTLYLIVNEFVWMDFNYDNDHDLIFKNLIRSDNLLMYYDFYIKSK